MDILYAKACLYAYPHIDDTLRRLHEKRLRVALASRNDRKYAMGHYDKIVHAWVETDHLIELKDKINTALEMFTQKDIDLFEYKYFHRKPKEYFKDFDYYSRQYFRRQISAVNRFASKLERLGINEEWIEENIKRYMTGYIRLAQEITDSTTKKNKSKK